MKRVLTSLALIPLICYVVLWGPAWLFFGVLALVTLICYHEFASIAALPLVRGLGPIGYAAGLLLLLVDAEVLLVLVVLTLLALAFSLRAEELSKGLPRAALLVLGVVYIFGCWKYAVLLRSVSPHWLMYALLLNWAGDIGAYYVGRSMGMHKLAPRISPAKSREGAVASATVSVIVGVLYLRRFLPAVPALEAILLSAVANVAGQFGDLSESAMKRGAGVKDSGSVLPGHGGLLDRVDSTLFALPVVYLYLRIR